MQISGKDTRQTSGTCGFSNDCHAECQMISGKMQMLRVEILVESSTDAAFGNVARMRASRKMYIRHLLSPSRSGTEPNWITVLQIVKLPGRVVRVRLRQRVFMSYVSENLRLQRSKTAGGGEYCLVEYRS